MECPACSYDMTQRRFDDVDCQICDLCGGIFVATMKSLALFRGMEQADEPDPQAIADAPQATDCPQGHGPLEAFGYMGSSLMLARCNACTHVWIPGAQRLPARTKWRKSQGRADRLLEEKHQTLSENRVVGGMGRSGRMVRQIMRDNGRDERLAELHRSLRTEDIADGYGE